MIENLVDKKSNIKKGHIDSALGTALYILRSIDEGQSREEIMQSLDNNEQLVSVWIQYLKSISWLKEDTQGNLLASEDGKSRIQQYEMAISSRLQDTDIISQQYETDKYQKEMVYFSQSAYAKFMETCVTYYWNSYWWWTLPLIDRIAETYAAALSRLVDNTKTVSKAVNEALSASKVFK